MLHKINWDVFYLLFGGKILCRIGVNPSLNTGWNSPVKPSGPEDLFVESLQIMYSISLIVMGLLR